MTDVNKKIEYLDDCEHIRLRPEVYVSSVIESDEEIFVIKPSSKSYNYSQSKIPYNVGMYKLFGEIVDNSLDEFKRMVKKTKKKLSLELKVFLDTSSNTVTVEDNGDGFLDPEKINEKTNDCNIITAFSSLKAGSNFKNINDDLIGSNGFGAFVVNALSENFMVESGNGEIFFRGTWKRFNEDFKYSFSKLRKKGTKVSWKPDPLIFKKSKYDKDIILSHLFLKKMSLRNNEELKNVKISYFVNNKEIKVPDVDDVFTNSYKIDKGFTLRIINDPNIRILMVNSTQCSGSITTVVEKAIDNSLKQQGVHKMCGIIISVFLPRNLVKFGDQNKSKFQTPYSKIQPVINDFLVKSKFDYRFKNSDVGKKALEDYEAIKSDKTKKKLNSSNIKKVRISKKYIPSSGKKDMLFIVEGDSAGGSIARSRDSKKHGIYTLKGVIPNVRNVDIIANNKELSELVSVLKLKFGSDKSSYDKIVITTDWDPDGIGHIASLLINFFVRWYPEVAREKLYILKIPLMSVKINGKLKYLYSNKEFDELNEKYTDKRYLKGLGALNRDDWKHIFKDINLIKVEVTDKSMFALDMAFSKDNSTLKKWLNGEISII